MTMDYTEKIEKIQPPAVAIDGAAIRSIREAKKLTQLYVASMVGVTTDTISSWENNRYPSIKRDNAEKLARALEVELGELLKKGEETSAINRDPDMPEESAVRPTMLRKSWLVSGAVLLLAVTIGMLVHRQQQQKLPVAFRQLPAYAAPGSVIPVKIVLQRQAGDRRGLILKEQLPKGWTLVAAAPAVMAQAPKLELKWLIPGGGAEKHLLYTVQVSAEAELNQEVKFSGAVILEEPGNARAEKIQGSSQIRVAGLHWADQNGDLRIDDAEIMPAYYLTEEFKGLSLNWQEIETIWNSSGYLWDRKAHAARPLP